MAVNRAEAIKALSEGRTHLIGSSAFSMTPENNRDRMNAVNSAVVTTGFFIEAETITTPNAVHLLSLAMQILRDSPGWTRVRAANSVDARFFGTRLGLAWLAFERALAHLQEVPVQPEPSRMFDSAGLIVVRASNFPANATLRQVGFRRACLQIHSGPTDDETVRENLAGTWPDAMRREGYIVGGWSVPRRGENLDDAAKRMAERVASLRLAYLIVDVEAFKDDTYGDTLSAPMVAALQRHFVPDFPIAFITFGEAVGDNVFCQPAPSGKPIIDFGPWLAARMPYAVEAYEGVGNYVDPVRVVEKALKCGWGAREVKPAIVSTDRAAEGARRLLVAHQQHGTVGFEVWDAANLQRGHAELRAAIEAGAAAR